MTDKDKKIIEDSEKAGIPIFVITAKDALSYDTLVGYKTLCEQTKVNISHIEGIKNRIKEFGDWQDNNLNKVKLPD